MKRYERFVNINGFFCLDGRRYMVKRLRYCFVRLLVNNSGNICGIEAMPQLSSRPIKVLKELCVNMEEIENALISLPSSVVILPESPDGGGAWLSLPLNVFREGGIR